MLNILITGGAGYVGSVLSQYLVENNYNILCVDNLKFGKKSIETLISKENFSLFEIDINDKENFSNLLTSNKIDAIIHLAAIVGDPACKLYADEAKKTNFETTKWLIDECIKLKIPKFIFASTCSNYGKMKNSSEYVDENSELKPLSLYAELKVEIEKYILNDLARDENFIPTILRFSTVYGHSERMRFDLTVNEFTKELTNNNELLVFGEQFWRPYCHVDDFANAFNTILKAPDSKIAYNVFNVGDTKENYTKKMIVDLLKKKLPHSKIKHVEKKEDPRDYRVNSDKIKNELGFRITKNVEQGIEELINLIKGDYYKDTEDQIYYNIPHKPSNEKN